MLLLETSLALRQDILYKLFAGGKRFVLPVVAGWVSLEALSVSNEYQNRMMIKGKTSHVYFLLPVASLFFLPVFPRSNGEGQSKARTNTTATFLLANWSSRRQ